MKMNRSGLVKEIQKKTGYDEVKSNYVVDVLEETFIVGKNNKEKMIADLIEKVHVDEEEANKIYEAYIETVGNGIKQSIKNFFTGKKD